jgi:hypothetical protein
VALVDGSQQRLAPRELLVEVAWVEAGTPAQRLDRGRAVALGAEQLEARIEQLLTPLRPALGGGLAAVAALAW